MAEALKVKGVQELAAFKQRVIRQYSRGHIDRSDFDRLIELVDSLEAHVISMRETIPRSVLKRGPRGN